MKRTAITIVCALSFGSAGLNAQVPDQAGHPAVDASADALTSAAEKRQWVRSQLIARLDDQKKVRHVDSRLAKMSPEQVNALVKTLQRRIENERLAQAHGELAQARAVRDRLRRDLHWRHGGRRGGVGFAPVITTLPEGASLWASAVVSPDRRYVRINAMPFFSSIGDVYTFNFANGKTKRYPRTGPPPFGQPQHPAARPQVWHDGLRTRIGPRP